MRHWQVCKWKSKRNSSALTQHWHFNVTCRIILFHWRREGSTLKHCSSVSNQTAKTKTTTKKNISGQLSCSSTRFAFEPMLCLFGRICNVCSQRALQQNETIQRRRYQQFLCLSRYLSSDMGCHKLNARFSLITHLFQGKCECEGSS